MVLGVGAGGDGGRRSDVRNYCAAERSGLCAGNKGASGIIGGGWGALPADLDVSTDLLKQTKCLDKCSAIPSNSSVDLYSKDFCV